MGWSVLTDDSEIVAIHAALLPTEPDGVVLYFGDWASPSEEIGLQGITETRLCGMAPGLVDPIDAIDVAFVPDGDVFCGGQAFLADGRLLAAGGTESWDTDPHGDEHAGHYTGERRCWMYLPRAGIWQQISDLSYQPNSSSIGGGRWYPTVVTLASGEAFAVGGHPALDDVYVHPAAIDPEDPEEQRHNNNTPERYSPATNAWTLLSDPTAPNKRVNDSFPRFHLMPGGLLFSDTAGRHGWNVVSNQRLFDPLAGVWTDTEVANLDVLPAEYNVGSEMTSVLLPLLPPSYRARVLACNSGHATAFRIDVDDSPQWDTTKGREGSAAGRARDNACATLLPTGQVLVTGGWPGNHGADEPDEAVTEPELYTPGINWDAGDFSASDEEGWVTCEHEDGEPERRGYHSTALLLPDGRVWVAGSTTTVNGGDGPNTTIELFAPDYVADAGRPTISDCPASVHYALAFSVATAQAESISRVALIRCGSITHAFNSDQRYVGLTFSVNDSGTLRVLSPPSADIAPPGYYMLWLIDTDGRVCERAAFVRLSRQKIVFSADISTYSVYEVEALGLPAQFEQALYLACDGFLPSEVTTPTYDLLRPDSTPVDGMSAVFGTPTYEAGASSADTAQRIVYPVRIEFDSTAAFDAIPEDQDFEAVALRAQMGSLVTVAPLQLSKKQNPRMSDGDKHWLSIDLRVFKTNPGDSPTAGIEHPDAGDDGAYDYIAEVIDAYNAWEGGQHPFDLLTTDQASNRLELGTRDVNGDAVFNYALARVRFRAPEGIDAADVRVFFRMWTTGATALEYTLDGRYRRSSNGPDATPLLGLLGGEILNVPCFAQPRSADMDDQEDEHNRRTLQGDGAREVYAYFGCWLDINQDVPRFPLEPQGNGPYTDADDPNGLRSIQQLMRGLHACLVAEIHYQLDPIATGLTPRSSDNLAQRNILFDFSDNPGGFTAHLVHHTLELKPSPVPLPPAAVSGGSSSLIAALHPDELVIEWGELPRDSLVTLYIPQLDASEVIRAAGLRQSPALLHAAAPDTIAWKVTEVGFMPIPGPLPHAIAGLLTIQLPPGVPYGKTYHVLLRQVDGRNHRVLATTELRIAVSRARDLVAGFEHNLAILKHIALAIPPTNRWYPVFKRYLDELGDRVRAFGGHPDTIDPSPSGVHHDRPPPPPRECITGRVSCLHYDCFGAFQGFDLVDCDARQQIKSCRRGIEAVALEACERNLRLTVCLDRDGCPRSLRLCC